MAERDPRSRRRDSRRATNLSVDSLLEEARRLRIHLSKAAEVGIEARVREGRQAEWLAGNESAIEASNRFVEERGLPLARLRRL